MLHLRADDPLQVGPFRISSRPVPGATPIGRPVGRPALLVGGFNATSGAVVGIS